MRRFIACSIGSLAMALALASMFSLLVPGPPLDRIVAGTFVTIVAWIVGFLRGLWAASPQEAWMEYTTIMFLCFGLTAWLW